MPNQPARQAARGGLGRRGRGGTGPRGRGGRRRRRGLPGGPGAPPGPACRGRGAGLPGDEDGETLLSVNADWGGVQAAGVELEVGEVRDGSGAALAVERLTDSSWSVTSDSRASREGSAWGSPPASSPTSA